MTTATTSLADFLLQRIADDEAVAREAQALARSPWRATYGRQVEEPEPGHLVTPEDEYAHSDEPPDAIALHIARHDPARVLADCAARRAIVELHVGSAEHGYGSVTGLACVVCVKYHADMDCENESWPCLTLRHLAAPYASDSDFDEAWAVS